jgi:S-adenosylmethionine:tRNA ribosyltransferase-isomerase
VLVSEFDFRLPEKLIAQQPLATRDASRMLCMQRATGGWSDGMFRDFPQLLRPTDLLVLNNTRVFPARLYGRRQGAEAVGNRSSNRQLPGRIEVLLTHQVSSEPNEWECLVRSARRIRAGDHLFLGENDELKAEVLAGGDFGERRIRFRPADHAKEDFFSTLDRIGHVPLPPYISRADSPADQDRYQTVYAQQRGSVAAPTAGLHFTPEIFDRIRQRGTETADITLHVGLGTFQPIRTDRVEDHKIHLEGYSISEEAASAINRALGSSRRIVAIGTTTVRTLEHAAALGGGTVQAGAAGADLFIYPGFHFKVVGAMLTNFHLPQSSLLMLVSAFAGKESTIRAYEHAVNEGYRFYSYGDCMFIE